MVAIWRLIRRFDNRNRFSFDILRHARSTGKMRKPSADDIATSQWMSAVGRELPFDPADVNVRSGVQIARSRQSGIGQHLPFGGPA